MSSFSGISFDIEAFSRNAFSLTGFVLAEGLVNLFAATHMDKDAFKVACMGGNAFASSRLNKDIYNAAYVDGEPNKDLYAEVIIQNN